MKSFYVIFFFCFIKLMAIEPYQLSELGEKWQFPSDHLPVGASIGKVHVVLWNTLDTQYLDYILENKQGLANSFITSANVPRDKNENFTLREEVILQNILLMTSHEYYPRNVLALEEVGSELFAKLNETLPKSLKVFPQKLKNGDIFIYDEDHFDLVDFKVNTYKVDEECTYLKLTLIEKETGYLYHFIQSHIPGGKIKSQPAREEVTQYLLNEFDQDAITVFMGDMNKESHVILKDLENAAEKLVLNQPFSNLEIPYPTHVNTKQEAVSIDNIFIYNPYEMKVNVAEPKDLFEGLQSIVNLLKSYNT